MSRKKDRTQEYLLDLNGIRYVVDDVLGLWVKFEAKKVPTKDRNHGMRYSLNLHDRTNQRIMRFDNAHAIEYDGKRYVAPKRTYDHWHFDDKDKGRPYAYETADKLLVDFWIEVDKKIKTLKGRKT